MVFACFFPAQERHVDQSGFESPCFQLMHISIVLEHIVVVQEHSNLQQR